MFQKFKNLNNISFFKSMTIFKSFNEQNFLKGCDEFIKFSDQLSKKSNRIIIFEMKKSIESVDRKIKIII